jgi:hypothetical protein
MSLKNQISALAEELTRGVLAAIRSASLEELLAEGGGRSSSGSASSARAQARESGAAKESGPAKDAGGAPVRKIRTGKGGRLARRSPEEIGAVVESIVVALRKNKTGMRSEQLQKLLRLDKREISGPLNEALAAKKITKKGQRRATTYFAR